jgi:hypothetical protein
MKTIALILAGLVSVSTHAAVSDLLFRTGGDTLNGAPGNVIFNGQHFVTPTVRTNGGIYLTFLDTNGVVVSNVSLAITGSSPRVVRDGADYLLAWLNTNDVPNVLASGRISQGALGPVSLLDTNIQDETISLSAAAGGVLAVWQSLGSNSAVFARVLHISAAPAGDTFAVAPSAQPQRGPSVDNDGTTYLIAWMEQNIVSNDWRVVAQRITGGALNNGPTQVSETNSMRPYATACSFGTNFLVVWSADEGPWPLSNTNTVAWPGATNVWRPTVHGRMLSESAVPLRHEFSMLRGTHYNTNVAATFGSRGYIVACHTWGNWESVQPLLADGTPREHLVDVLWGTGGFDELRPRVAAVGDRYCLLYQTTPSHEWRFPSVSVVLAPKYVPELRMKHLRRTNNTIVVDHSYLSAQGTTVYATVQVSTNMIDWEWLPSQQLPSLPVRPLLYFRLFDSTWECVNNLRQLHQAKQDWWFDHFYTPPYVVPTVNQLIGSPSLLPRCPYGGSYSIQSLDIKPTCTIANHTF